MKRAVSLILTSIMLFSLAACGKGGRSGKNGEPVVLADMGSDKTGESVTLAVETLASFDSNIRLASPADGGLYAFFFNLNEDGGFSYRLAFADTEGNMNELSSDWLEGRAPVNMCACPEGGVWTVRTLAKDDRDGLFEYELGRLNREGFYAAVTKLPEGLSVTGMCAVGSRVFAALSDFKGRNLLMAYNSDGTEDYSIDMESPNYSIVSDGERMYMLTFSDNGVNERGFVLYSFDPGSKDRKELFSFTQGNLLACDGGLVYISDTTAIYVYDTATGSTEQVLRWESAGLRVASTSICTDGRGGYLAWNPNMGIKHLQPRTISRGSWLK